MKNILSTFETNSSGFVTGTSGHLKIPIVVGRFTRFFYSKSADCRLYI